MRFYCFAASLLALSMCEAINRPVYKIILTQKGFAQFLQYDVDTPPLREFTFCTWIKFYDFTRDQTLFNYIVHGNDHILRLWLDSGGHFIKISLNGKVSSSNPVDFSKGIWQHVCFSYQSDYGAWALYTDGRLVACEVSQSLQGFVLPAGGSVIIGYGTSNDGASGGLEGEIFGANMILASTIERNYTMKRNPKFKQRYFHKNKVTSTNNIKYIILGDMQTATTHNKIETTTSPTSSTQSYISIKTPYSTVEHDVGIDLIPQRNTDNMLGEKASLHQSGAKSKRISNDDDKISFWNIIDDATSTPIFKGKSPFFQDSQNKLSLSTYEMPPSTSQVEDYSKFQTNSFMKISAKPMIDFNRNSIMKTIKLQNAAISNIKTSPVNYKDNNMFGLRPASNFANSVLKYLKNSNINTKNDYRKVPPTIPLFKVSDSFPYASNTRLMRAFTPHIFQRKHMFDHHSKLMKRDIENHQINVQILKDELRDGILKSHTKLNPINVEITNRGKRKSRVYRKSDNSKPEIILSDVFKPRPFSVVTHKLNKTFPLEFRKNTRMPFLKSSEYSVEDKKIDTSDTKNEAYSKSLSDGNKWHNVKTYSNDYTPRKINVDLSGTHTNKVIDNIQNKKLPSIKLKYIPDNHKVIKTDIDHDIIQGRNLAIEISNTSNAHSETVSILKYNHGFLPGHEHVKNVTSSSASALIKGLKKEHNFNQNIKIGNALNERHIIGVDETQNRQSFVGGNENIPDIIRYRSELDKTNEQVPPSLGSKVCKNLELFDRLLYIQPDGSVDTTHILSPLKEKNIGITFIVQNYKKCSLQESDIENHPLLFIDWNNTPVRLFGGANPRKTTDLCGFF
ncbi:unnamed protein product [Leptosia nina]|uniref:Pentraxin (PTX) domain-containing protein n=1 Tax=Leptosia nina TaxID=320188 RepID=A0AAV1K0R8_9NEOP